MTGYLKLIERLEAAERVWEHPAGGSVSLPILGEAAAAIRELWEALETIANTDEKDIHAQYFARKALAGEGE